jgi:hypothetical protein
MRTVWLNRYHAIRAAAMGGILLIVSILWLLRH